MTVVWKPFVRGNPCRRAFVRTSFSQLVPRRASPWGHFSERNFSTVTFFRRLNSRRTIVWEPFVQRTPCRRAIFEGTWSGRAFSSLFPEGLHPGDTFPGHIFPRGPFPPDLILGGLLSENLLSRENLLSESNFRRTFVRTSFFSLFPEGLHLGDTFPWEIFPRGPFSPILNSRRAIVWKPFVQRGPLVGQRFLKDLCPDEHFPACSLKGFTLGTLSRGIFFHGGLSPQA